MLSRTLGSSSLDRGNHSLRRSIQTGTREHKIDCTLGSHKSYALSEENKGRAKGVATNGCIHATENIASDASTNAAFTQQQ